MSSHTTHHIILVDDDRNILTSVSMALEAEGYKITTFNDGESGLQGILDNDRSPSRKVGEPDNRDSHYWFARYWAEELANQDSDKELKEFFTKLSAQLEENKDKILEEMTVVQGNPADIGGYYHPPMEKVCEVMQPSATLNRILEEARASVK